VVDKSIPGMALYLLTPPQALPAMDRTWVIPASGDCPQISLCLHEPTLTGDDLGHKTWASSYLLSQKLSYIANAHFGEFNIHKVLELGSGTGLLGLAAAAILQCEATLTDLSPIIPNLIENATRNESVIGARGGTVRTEVLDWNQLSSSPIIGRFPVCPFSRSIQLYLTPANSTG
jgi:hypothetical protein